MTTYVLIPGACHGAWCFDDLTAALRNEGHRVLSYTLTGVAERAHLAHAGVNLETHITDVLAALEAESDADDLVLVGHSYGGMVITGVADRIPEKVDALVYLDALVPRDGESCWHLVNDEEREWYLGVDETGYGVPPMPFFDPRASAHPLASFMQRITLTGDVDRVPSSRLRLRPEVAGRLTAAAVVRTRQGRSRLERPRARRRAQSHARQPRRPPTHPAGCRRRSVAEQRAELLSDCLRLAHPLHPAVECGLGVGGIPPALLGERDHARLVVDTPGLRVAREIRIVLQGDAVDRLPDRVIGTPPSDSRARPLSPGQYPG